MRRFQHVKILNVLPFYIYITISFVLLRSFSEVITKKSVQISDFLHFYYTL